MATTNTSTYKMDLSHFPPEVLSILAEFIVTRKRDIAVDAATARAFPGLANGIPNVVKALGRLENTTDLAKAFAFRRAYFNQNTFVVGLCVIESATNTADMSISWMTMRVTNGVGAENIDLLRKLHIRRVLQQVFDSGPAIPYGIGVQIAAKQASFSAGLPRLHSKCFVAEVQLHMHSTTNINPRLVNINGRAQVNEQRFRVHKFIHLATWEGRRGGPGSSMQRLAAPAT